MTIASAPLHDIDDLEHEPRERVHVWDIVVRATHWVIALSVVALAITGVYIGRPFLVAPGEAGHRFVMGTVKAIHFYAAIAFTLAVLARIVWMFTGGYHARWYNFMPVTRARLKAMVETAKYYAFLRRRPPISVGHNPLAGAAYAVIFVLYLVMIATGLGMYAAQAPAGYMRSFGFFLDVFGGPQSTRFIHHIVMWLLIAFVFQHLYSSIVMTAGEANGTIDSIFSGNKWLPRSIAAKDRAARRSFENKDRA